jgi:hypothetical protein
MAVDFLSLMATRTLVSLKDQLKALCEANKLPVTSWFLGDPSERWLDITPRMVNAVLSGITTQAVRGFFLDLATDPGDAGDLSSDQTPRAGFLSALGEGWYGTVRRGETYATTTVTLRNTGSNPTLAIPAYGLTFTTEAPEPVKADGGRPTYRNTSLTVVGLAPGASVTFDVICERSGPYGNASADALTLVTHSFDGAGVLEVTTSAVAIGQGRESATAYRARCRLAASKLSPGGPTAAYRYAATTARDGSALQRHDGSGAVGITRVYVSANSSTGAVFAYYADDDGAADTVDVDSANANCAGTPLGVITDPLGVVPDCVTFTGAAATETVINITGTAKIKSVPGTDDVDLAAAAEAAIEDAYAAFFAATPIGGVDQVAGAGKVLKADLAGVVYTAYPGLHAVAITGPGSDTNIAEGYVAKLGTVAVTVSVVP